MDIPLRKTVILSLSIAAVQLFAFPCLCQESKVKKFMRLSCPEKGWVIAHPFAASKAMRVSEDAQKETNNMAGSPFLDNYVNGGKLDAFRHCYWMALLCVEMHCRKARKLGKAHERGNKKDFKKGTLEEGYLPDQVSSTMDLWNNEVGIKIGRANSKSKASAIKENVIQAIRSGECKIIRRDEHGRFLDCDGLPIQEKEWKGLWENSKCLILSNQ